MNSKHLQFLCLFISILAISSIKAQSLNNANKFWEAKNEKNIPLVQPLITPHNPFNILNYKLKINLYDNFIPPILKLIALLKP